MKYIRLFEGIFSYEYKYLPGDYVVLDLDLIQSTSKEVGLPSYLPISQIALITKYFDQYYQVEFFNGFDDDFYLVTDADILRKATEEEVEDFKEKKEAIESANKYNI